MMSVSPIGAADAAQRAWHGDESGPIRIGSDRHKTLFSRMLLDTFDPYKPAVIDWPHLDAAARHRLVSLPISDIAVQTEGKASVNVCSYAARVGDPLLRQAIELNGFEEGRHKTVLSNLVEAHGIKLAPEPPYPPPRDPEWAFVKTGYSECIDSFFRAGGEANDGKDFSPIRANAFLERFTFRRFLEDCYAENARRMSAIDQSLLRPGFLPALADVALRGLRPCSRRAEAWP
jgi:hypothetical protein